MMFELINKIAVIYGFLNFWSWKIAIFLKEPSQARLALV